MRILKEMGSSSVVVSQAEEALENLQQMATELSAEHADESAESLLVALSRVFMS